MDPIHALAGFLIAFLLCWSGLAFYFLPKRAERHLERSLSKHPRYAFLKQSEALVKRFCSQRYAMFLSLRARRQLHLWHDDFVYGEVRFLSFFELLEKASPKPGEIFYDLGAGSGRAVLTAGLCFDFKHAIGIELLPILFNHANTQLARMKRWLSQQPYLFRLYRSKIASILFFNENFLSYSFSDGDIIYISATCFSDDLWKALVLRLSDLKPGSRILVTTRLIQHEKFLLRHAASVLMSWGPATVRLYDRI